MKSTGMSFICITILISSPCYGCFKFFFFPTFWFQDVCSRSPSILSLKTAERFTMELRKSSGSLGISVAVSGLFVINRYIFLYSVLKLRKNRKLQLNGMKKPTK